MQVKRSNTHHDLSYINVQPAPPIGEAHAAKRWRSASVLDQYHAPDFVPATSPGDACSSRACKDASVVALGVAALWFTDLVMPHSHLGSTTV
jgi:hypothetical protein